MRAETFCGRASIGEVHAFGHAALVPSRAPWPLGVNFVNPSNTSRMIMYPGLRERPRRLGQQICCDGLPRSRWNGIVKLLKRNGMPR